MEWKQTTTVRVDGRIELLVPPFQPGQIVEVFVREEGDRQAHETNKSRREPGSARGRVRIHDDFDAPLPEFEQYL